MYSRLIIDEHIVPQDVYPRILEVLAQTKWYLFQY
jgi:hypothetical protein